MATSENQMDRLVQQLRSHEQRARRLTLSYSAASILIASLALGGSVWKIHTAHRQLANRNAEFDSLRQALNSKDKEVADMLVAQRREHETEIKELQADSERVQTNQSIGVHRLRQELAVTHRKNLYLAKEIYIERATNAEVKSKLDAVIAELALPVRSFEMSPLAGLAVSYLKLSSNSEKLDRSLSNSESNSIDLYKELQSLYDSVNVSRIKDEKLKSQAAQSLQKAYALLNTFKDSKHILGDVHEQALSAKDGFILIDSFFKDTKYVVVNSQNQLIDARDKLFPRGIALGPPR